VQGVDPDVRAVVLVAQAARGSVGEQDVDGPGGAPLQAPDPPDEARGAAVELALAVLVRASAASSTVPSALVQPIGRGGSQGIPARRNCPDRCARASTTAGSWLPGTNTTGRSVTLARNSR